MRQSCGKDQPDGCRRGRGVKQLGNACVKLEKWTGSGLTSHQASHPGQQLSRRVNEKIQPTFLTSTPKVRTKPLDGAPIGVWRDGARGGMFAGRFVSCHMSMPESFLSDPYGALVVRNQIGGEDRCDQTLHCSQTVNWSLPGEPAPVAFHLFCCDDRQHGWKTWEAAAGGAPLGSDGVLRLSLAGCVAGDADAGVEVKVLPFPFSPFADFSKSAQNWLE